MTDTVIRKATFLEMARAAYAARMDAEEEQVRTINERNQSFIASYLERAGIDLDSVVWAAGQAYIHEIVIRQGAHNEATLMVEITCTKCQATRTYNAWNVDDILPATWECVQWLDLHKAKGCDKGKEKNPTHAELAMQSIDAADHKPFDQANALLTVGVIHALLAVVDAVENRGGSF